MKIKCDKCSRPATHHSVEIVNGKKIEKHLCDQHAAEEGLSVKAVHTPINELLNNFVKLHSGGETDSGEDTPTQKNTCDHCELTFKQFREDSLLGCPHCYRTFENKLSPLLERAHEGGTHHIGKVPHRAGVGEQRQMALQRLRRQLDDAVEAEDYELAARLRDEVHEMETDD